VTPRLPLKPLIMASKTEAVQTSNDESKQEDNQITDNIDIIDTHIHLWNAKTAKRDWLSTKGLEILNRDYNINSYYAMLNNQPDGPYIHLRSGIFMETDVVADDIGVEISEITKLCKNPNNNIKGMVVKLDPDVSTKDFKQKVSELKDNPYIVGVRKVLLGTKGKMSKQFTENMQLLSEDTDVDWTFDVCININQLPHIYPIVQSCKNMMFVLDHMANGHEICGDDKVFKKWSAEIEKFSKLDNVAVKLSGLSGGQPGIDGAVQWKFAMETKRIDFVLKHFNPERIVYGSDWPVSILPIAEDERDDFLSLWTMNLYKYIVKNHGKEFAQNVFVNNAARIYKVQQ